MSKVITDENGNTCTYAELYKWIAIAYLAEAADRDARDAQAIIDLANLELAQDAEIE